MHALKRTLAVAAAAAALALTTPTAHAATTVTPAATNPVGCPAASDFTLTAPSHTEVGGDLLDKQVTFGAYWAGGNVPAGTRLTLTAGPATVTLLNGLTYVAPVVAGGTISGEFPNGGAAFAPSFRLLASSAASPGGPTSRYNVTSISYPVTVLGYIGACHYTVTGTATSSVNVTSLTVS